MMLHRQICSQFGGEWHITVVATDHEIGQGRNISWTLWASPPISGKMSPF